tara:strand:+ start:153 stop:641 length:489 start_codon:yes stop_codon:yes gene_type:complete
MGVGNEADKIFEGPKDFVLDSFDFIKKNLDKVLMVTIIFFLILTWTTLFEWDFPEKKNIILKKKITFDKTNVNIEGFGKKVYSRDEILNNLKNTKCGSGELCKKHKDCLNKNPNIECWNEKDCCSVNIIDSNFCVGGSASGPTFRNRGPFNEWWYLGKYYKR